MLEEEDEEEKPQEEAAPQEGGIRLGRKLGKKKGGVERSAAPKKVLKSDGPKTSMGGYDQRDVSSSISNPFSRSNS